MIKRCLPAVVDERIRVLILGSLPGEVSLACGQYYANPRNQFWRLTAGVTGLALCGQPYEARLQALLGARIGVWDVVRSASRNGSLDADIRDYESNALNTFVESLADLQAVAFNGGKAAQIGRKQLCVEFKPEVVTLPSSSPANTVPFALKQERWMALKRFLDQ
jgi:TDG/mug DNA glycosylase family protein